MVLEECYLCPEYCGCFFCLFVLLKVCFLGMSVNVANPVWLSEGSELHTCVVAIFKTCSAASVIEGDLLGNGYVVCVSCVCLLKLTLPCNFLKHADFSKSSGLLPLEHFLGCVLLKNGN